MHRQKVLSSQTSFSSWRPNAKQVKILMLYFDSFFLNVDKISIPVTFVDGRWWSAVWPITVRFGC